jgi:hypothetical protein
MSVPVPDRSAALEGDYRAPGIYVEQDAFNELNSIPLNDILDQDSRPTFVLDLDSDRIDYGLRKDELRPIFSNSALRFHETLLEKVTGVVDPMQTGDTGATYLEFHSWATSWSKFDDSRDVFPLTFLYAGMLWTGSTIRQRFRIISGNRCYDTSLLPKNELLRSEAGITAGGRHVGEVTLKACDSPVRRPQPSPMPPAQPVSTPLSIETNSVTLITSSRGASSKERSSKISISDGKSGDTSGSSNSITLSSPEDGVPDWTAKQPSGILTEHVKFARSVNWAATPLGPMSCWSPEFREISNLLMKNPHPAALFWGEELTMLYNEAYAREVAGNKHPDLMGTGKLLFPLLAMTRMN